MKRTKKKLQLDTQTVAKLSTSNLARVRGGGGLMGYECTLYDSGCFFQTTQGSVQTSACPY